MVDGDGTGLGRTGEPVAPGRSERRADKSKPGIRNVAAI